MKRRFLCLWSAFCMVCSFSLTACALQAPSAPSSEWEDTAQPAPVSTSHSASAPGFSDISPEAWYAEAVRYCYENGLMSGTSASSFSPEIAP